MDGEADHLHLLVSMPPKVAPASLVNSLKGVSSRHLRSRRFPEVRRALWGDHFWSPSYFVASTGGAPLAKVKAYIQQQRGIPSAPHPGPKRPGFRAVIR
jgi:putative transposase